MYNSGKLAAIVTTNYGKNKSLLDHVVGLKDHFTTHPVSSVKEAFGYILAHAKIQCSLTAVRLFLHRNGFKPLKTGHIPGKANPEVQAEFLEKTLKPLIDKANSETIELLFMDAAHFVHGVFISVLWSAKRIFIKSPSGRQRVNILGAINAKSLKISWYTNNDYINANCIIVFFKQLRTEYLNKPICIVLDNARYQHCEAVTKIAEQYNITLVFLPPYSPNLNIIERLWKFVKKKALNSMYYDSFDKFKTAILDCLSECNTNYNNELKTLCTTKFQLF
jgi:transposase